MQETRKAMVNRSRITGIDSGRELGDRNSTAEHLCPNRLRYTNGKYRIISVTDCDELDPHHPTHEISRL